jgi:conjugation system TraG family ATPase
MLKISCTCLGPITKAVSLTICSMHTENLELLKERFIVFELDNIKDHPILFPVVTIIIMEVFISKMRKLKGVRKMILIEEAWKAIAKEGMAEYIKYLFKTVRKFFGEAIVVTQEVEDIISSPVVKQAIINNSDCKILLDQSKYQNKFDLIQQLLGLTEKEKALILSINKSNDPKRKYKEVFISLAGVLSKVYATEVSLGRVPGLHYRRIGKDQSSAVREPLGMETSGKVLQSWQMKSD